MTTYGVIGEAEASRKLITATLNDLMEAHTALTPDDDFWFIIGTGRSPNPSIEAVMDWCSKSGTYFEVVTSADVPFDGAGGVHLEEDFNYAAVERLYNEGTGHRQLLALVGPEDPPVDVTRAIARATDSLIEVRDLTEGALTYIKFYGDAVNTVNQQEENPVPAQDEEVEVTLEELPGLGEEADEEGDDSAAATTLAELAAEMEIDVNDYSTWSEVAAAIYEAADGDDEDDEESEEEEEEVGEWTAEALKGLKLTEVRAHGKAAGIPGADKMRREDLVKALLSGTAVEESDDEEEEEAPATKAPAKKAPASSGVGEAEVLAALKVIRDFLTS